MPLPTSSVVNTIEEAKSLGDEDNVGSSPCDKVDDVAPVVQDAQLCPLPVDPVTIETQAGGANTSADGSANDGGDKQVAPVDPAQDTATAQPAAAESAIGEEAHSGERAGGDAGEAELAHQASVPPEADAGSADIGAGGREDGQVVGQAQPGDDDVLVVEAPSAGPRLLGKRNTLRARAQEELERGDHAEAFERMRAKLHADDEQIKEKEGLEQEALKRIQEASLDIQAVTEEVAKATAEEALACKALKEVERRQREAKAKTQALRDELLQYKDVMVILDMKIAKRKADEQEALAKRRKIEELEQVLEESKREAERIWQREQEAKEEMKKLLKEEKKLQVSRLGRFTMRHRQKMLKNGNESTEAEGSAVVIADAGAPPTGTSFAAAASDAPAPVHVKREVMQAFSVPRDLPEMIIVIEDESQ